MVTFLTVIPPLSKNANDSPAPACSQHLSLFVILSVAGEGKECEESAMCRDLLFPDPGSGLQKAGAGGKAQEDIQVG